MVGDDPRTPNGPGQHDNQNPLNYVSIKVLQARTPHLGTIENNGSDQGTKQLDFGQYVLEVKLGTLLPKGGDYRIPLANPRRGPKPHLEFGPKEEHPPTQ